MPPVVTIRPAKSVGELGERRGDGVATVLAHLVIDDFEPGGRQLLDEGAATGVVSGSVGDAVADREHLGAELGVGHAGATYWRAQVERYGPGVIRGEVG